MKNQTYDLIGDIHGQHAKLLNLLTHLGYLPHDEGFRHPEGRKIVFLGDYIDRGPKIRETLLTVRAMVEAGDALAIMGNHEYNAVCYHTPDGKSGHLRQRRQMNVRQHAATKHQFAGRDAEWGDWIEWMKRLPMFLDLGGLRAVHACWDARGLALINGRTIADDDFLHVSADKGSPEFLAVENILKGPELALPDGHVFHDKEGTARHKVRVRWWDLPAAARISHLNMPEPFDIPGDAHPDDLRGIPDYGAGEPPVFVGHYWLPPERAHAPLKHNIACLDFSAAFGDNPLVGYRWEGEHHLEAANFVTTAHP
ncbi:metallophosphoesterase [Prosthecobacter sp.]|uniref:metallophosphoesterase n=1 Tax=Prosthecobacter sp. TaxID=1965333 RepID=UPI0024894092|nr:metallophosphoesterase [Prosthecobacter sp.]MDI1315137.1 metallophosphoesterase [Prosthecobacter sp.]